VKQSFFDAVKMQNYFLFIIFWLRSTVAPFYWGSAPFSENEMPELNGRMTPRQVNICVFHIFVNNSNGLRLIFSISMITRPPGKNGLKFYCLKLQIKLNLPK
jgi:hypothetical protein